ncbi:hypothetical protein G6O67_005885 [Ophiocordyceps sinensis]|uniref:Cytochrome b5 heme-binding domain-containing protein n=1 Tax=Ophiocordyceps sinensis TaxID=72228 RepID=A0A8H4LX70_9HYPO|nr:hypothetical protein G6O67_005885 [Ophiocordyceps sinensis]
MTDSKVRQRRPQGEAEPPSAKEAVRAGTKEAVHASSRADADDRYSPWLDVLRVLTFLLLASCGLSYVISGGESWAWGVTPRLGFLQPDWWRAKMAWPVYMTLHELSAYDGRDPDKPLYLGINGTIYDVSNGRHMYGPGASYHAFAGHDSARAFVTTCIEQDNNPDLHGVEQMFLPLDDQDTDAYWSAAEMAKLRADELEAAKERAYLALKNWADFFANSNKYHRVGYVKMDEGWLEKQPVKELCAKAQKGRTKRQTQR